MTVLDKDHPRTAPLVFAGAEPIDAYCRDICGQNIRHEVRDLVSTACGLAYTQHCRFPGRYDRDLSTVATTHDGRISNQTAVQAWEN
ncbi:nuclear transport factor 2 family protein [Actinoplanes sp. CA-051413]|uniref:nuclear transport factor 2 family protein n=1 Tax=Actinoplanes sp. CA-051413 TaxID=3239899 RepID=UPI003D964981